MEHYLKLLLEQIRCKRVHPYIKEEIQAHIEDQIEDNIQLGMTMEEAEKAAVEDMGSPVEVGIALDRIHRPKAAWGLIGLMAVISMAGIIFHELIAMNLQKYMEGDLLQSLGSIGRNIVASRTGSANFALYTLIGFVCMLIIYHIDYSVIARFAKVLALIMIGIIGYGLFAGTIIGGMRYAVRILGMNIHMPSMMMLYVPLYGAIIYSYYGKGYTAIVKSLLWMLVPTWITLRLPSLVMAAIMLVSMSVVLTIAIINGWFQVSKKRVIGILWGVEVVLPIGGLTAAYVLELLETYQIARIRSFLSGSGDANYITNILRVNFRGSSLLGAGSQDTVAYLPNFNSDYIFSYLISSYGLLVGAIVFSVFAVLIYTVFSVSFKQRNQLGICMGCGCGMIFLLNAVINVAENIGILPLSTTFLPFLSTGGRNLIVCYILMGIVLSIYRYKDIYPREAKRHISAVE